MIYDLSLAFIIGLIAVGSGIYRTVKVVEGKPLAVFLLEAIVASGYYISMSYVAKNQPEQYFSFAFGAAVSTTILAWIRRKKRNE